MILKKGIFWISLFLWKKIKHIKVDELKLTESVLDYFLISTNYKKTFWKKWINIGVDTAVSFNRFHTH